MKSKNDGSTPAPTATTATPMKVRGLLDVIEAEATGQDWVLDEIDPLAGVNFGLGASPEARRLALLGLVSERIAEIDRQLAGLKPRRGRPQSNVTIDMKRAAAVLVADELHYREHGERLPTQKAALEHALNIEPDLFGNMTSFKRLQTSVSKGLRELGTRGERFSKK